MVISFSLYTLFPFLHVLGHSTSTTVDVSESEEVEETSALQEYYKLCNFIKGCSTWLSVWFLERHITIFDLYEQHKRKH